MSFGLNSKYYDSSLTALINSGKNFSGFAKNYYIRFLRYPGGLESRTYFWDKPSLTPQARLLYANVLRVKSPDKLNKAKHNEQLSENGSAVVSVAQYGNFLNFCKKNDVTPIIVLNTWYYHDENKVYAICSDDKLDDPKWDQILDNIKKQIEYTHTVYNATVYWEIGNEDNHIYSAEIYSQIVNRYASVIKASFPNDKVLINFSNPTGKKIEANWNENVINALASSKAIKYIDFIAPHYYRGFKTDENYKSMVNSDDIAARFKKLNIFEETQRFDQTLHEYPNIHIFFTEFGLFPKVTNPNYNSQLEGLLMLYYLMEFNASKRVDGIIRHGFTQTSSGFYFDNNTFKQLKYNFNPEDDKTYNIFKYIPPKAKVVKIFFDNNPIKATKFVETNSYSYTVSTFSNSSACIINLINFGGTPVNFDIKDILNNMAGEKLTLTTYRFADLNNKQWSNNKTSLEFTSTVQLPSYSYSVINTAK